MRAAPNDPTPPRPGPRRPGEAAVGWRWHLAAVVLLSVATLWNGWAWLTLDHMPGGDFAGYAARVQRVRDALLEHGGVPRWCVECYGGTANFTGNLKEILVFPLALAVGPVMATKLAFLLLKLVAGLGLYALIARRFAAPAAGIVAGYALAFGAVANHQLEHLDAVLATALLPPTVWAAWTLLHGRRKGAALVLGALAAAQLMNNWVFALSVPLAVIALAGFAPRRAGAPHPWRRRGEAARQATALALALAVFFVLAASTLAWTAADAPNHRLVPEASAARQRLLYVERSPFLFVNRANALAGWLSEHQPPGFDLARSDGGRRYLGIVVLAVCLVGLWVGARGGAARWRRWAAVASALFGLQYWLSLGPRTLLWEVGTSFHWTEGTLALVRHGMLAASAGLAVAAFALHRRRSTRARAALVAAVVSLGGVTSLWSGLAAVLPVLEVQRSPGHFFDVAPVWLALLFALALVALERALSGRAALALVVAIGFATVADFAPSRRAFRSGFPLDPLRRAGEMVATVPGQQGSLRIGLPIRYQPEASWVLEQADAGHAWGWLPWQSGRYWADYYAAALYAKHGPRPDGRGPIEPEPALLRAARISYLLMPIAMEPPPGWRRADRAGRFALWEGPEGFPLARGFRATAWLEDAERPGVPALAALALRSNVLLVSPPPEAGEDPALSALRAAARVVLSPGIASPARLAVAPVPIEVTAQRDGPERLTLVLDAGEAPAVVSVSEGHHPWWRAEVDGLATPVLRASHAMMAVPVGPGEHTVSMHFEPPGVVRVAEAASAIGWVGAVAIALAASLRAITGRNGKRKGAKHD